MCVYSHPILYNESLKMKNLHFYWFGHNKNYINILKTLFYIIVNLHKTSKVLKSYRTKTFYYKKCSVQN